MYVKAAHWYLLQIHAALYILEDAFTMPSFAAADFSFAKKKFSFETRNKYNLPTRAGFNKNVSFNFMVFKILLLFPRFRGQSY